MDDETAGRPSRPSRPLRVRTILKIAFFTSAGFLFLTLAAGIGLYLIVDHATRSGSPGEPVEFQVPAGSTGREIAILLHNAELIEHPVFFRVVLFLDKSSEPIKAGVFKLPKGLSALEYLRMLQRGENRVIDIERQHKITVLEGLTLRQMAELFDDPDAFVSAASEPALMERLEVDAPTAEGFLMPDTYYFAKKPSEEQMVLRMIEHFERTYAELEREFPELAGRDKLEVVTIASLIEEEAALDEERPLVAAVIYNRLDRNYALQLDTTLQYALNKYGKRILDKDKEVDSPYNTYRYPGLPPGPIASPGEASLRAAIRPADVDYLYFVANGDGKTHTFSKTLREHNQAVARYRQIVAEQRRQQRGQRQND